MNKKGILLINLGTPDNCTGQAVYRYLTEFLNDPHVIDLPFMVRFLLVNLVIVPTRFKKSAHAYQKIWTDQGSPLLVNSLQIKDALAKELGDEYQVELGMRYGNPSIKSALAKLKNCSTLKIVPLFPQYSSAATGSAIEKALRLIGKHLDVNTVNLVKDFYDNTGFIDAFADNIRKTLQNKKIDKILLSYHGLPQRHIEKMPKSLCYRTQCFQTSELLAKQLNLNPEQYIVCFQSRLGRTPWIKPYTDLVLPELIQHGIKNIAIACPSFVADCLETLEEINIRAREQWQALGGEEFVFIPCINAHPEWIKGLAGLVCNN